jgi:hypothetical protein
MQNTTDFHTAAFFTIHIGNIIEQEAMSTDTQNLLAAMLDVGFVLMQNSFATFCVLFLLLYADQTEQHPISAITENASTTPIPR